MKMKKLIRYGCCIGLVAILLSANVFAQGIVISDLRCEHEKDPLGIDAGSPRLSWLLQSDGRCTCQTSYRVLVASSPAKLEAGQGDLWDSGKVRSDQSHLLSYAGKKLSSHQQCFWKVRIWDAADHPSQWSPSARWTMGILSPRDWSASWIAASPDSDPASPAEKQHKQSRLPIFRREFRVTKPLRRAVVYVCGLGHYELYLNGSKVGDRLLDPPWTNYRRKCIYATYEITSQICSDDNALGVMLGNGMYNVVGGRYTKFRGSFGRPKFILHLRLEYDDGTVGLMASDSSWKVAEGPITFSCVYGGEDWDARLEPAGWLKTGFDDASWSAAMEISGSQDVLRATVQPPVKAMQVFKPVTINETDKGVSVDFGQNSAAIPVLRLHGPCGSTVKVRTGEGPTAAGWDNTWFKYTLRGGGAEQFRPRFTSWGCRSILVEGATLNGKAADKPVVLEARALSLRCDSPSAGSFACSDELLNKIYRIVLWSIHSNYQSVLTDCPHREKLGWQEVSHLMAPSIHFIYNAAGFYDKIIDDCAEAQTPDGLVPDIAPEYVVFDGGFRDSPEWGSAFIINPHFLYLWTGDDAPIAKHYEAMKRYLDYLSSKSRDHILSHGLGDWLPRDKTPTPLVATAIYYRDLVLMAGYASRLGKHEDALQFQHEAQEVKKAFNTRFLNADAGSYAGGTQCAQGMSYILGLVPPQQREKALAVLVEDGRKKNGLTAGDVGNRYAILAFSAAGADELLYQIASNTYGVQARQASRTTLAEAWAGGQELSQNHCMLGHIMEWCHGRLAGIRPDPSAAGFRKIIIDPSPVESISWVKAHHDSPYGRVAVYWHKEADGLHLDVTVPANTTATVFVPAEAASDVIERKLPADKADGVEFLQMRKGKAVFSVASGNYEFISKRSSFSRPIQPARGGKTP